MNREEINKLHEKNSYLEQKIRELNLELQQKDRSLKIETALEKISAKTIAMQNSLELLDTSAVLFNQLEELGIKPVRTSVGILDEKNDAMELWLTNVSETREVMKVLDFVNLHIHPVYEKLLSDRRRNEPFSLTVLSGDEIKQFYQMMSTYLSMPEKQIRHEKEYFYFFFFNQGALSVNTYSVLTEEECDIIKQFADVFGLIYKRFLDLQEAELQAIKAHRQTALERVRAEISSMRTVDDLNRITPLIWKELVNLGVPFFRCGVFIIEEAKQTVHAYLTTPEGASLGVLHLSFESLATISNLVENWRQQKLYAEQWDSKQFQDWVAAMYRLGQINEIRKFQAGDAPVDSLSLQFIPFSQGMLYIGSHNPLEDWELDLVKSLANSFSVAYARYEDFKQLQESKNRIESTLSELRATQSQLIQSEKMASLGELTAGIAHEIQNPLNFVNNFSEINKELIEELRQAILKNDLTEIETLLNDIHENEEKVKHHGKRAEGIVKSMLQHSRKNSGEKELTDINALCDEYLRLAYHGFRAKDKNFNVEFKLELDPDLPKIRIVPQDIGRVLLNLINNAFYFLDKKSKEGLKNYRPVVIVKTRAKGDSIEICVKDNGPGIPEQVRDKIFQPFFTTKPTGQGTGLGLSLSYDIITKGHNGEIRANTKHGEGTEFIIILPI